MNSCVSFMECMLLSSISIFQSRLQQKITKLAQTEKTTFLYAADRIGYIYAYNVERFDPKHKTPKGKSL